jgi:8-oxo-dGTP pyrophosphatase MutT (NUDIX family)
MRVDFSESNSAIYEKIKRELSDLPGERAHMEMSPLRGRSSEELKKAQSFKVSAVLALIYQQDGQLFSLLTERQTYKGKHSGQMSFPGGKMEDFDKNPGETALRETQEEVGIAPHKIELLGQLTDVYIPVSQFLVHPFLGYTATRPITKKEEREVQSIIHFPLEELLDNNNRIETRIKMDNGMILKDVPAFQIQNKIVWGATALMLNELKEILNRI